MAKRKQHGSVLKQKIKDLESKRDIAIKEYRENNSLENEENIKNLEKEICWITRRLEKMEY